MPQVDTKFAALPRDPRLQPLAPFATGAAPAWLWRADGTRILWANAVGAGLFGAATPGACLALDFDPNHAAAMEIARLAAGLPAGGQSRLERLRGFGAGSGGALTCACSRLALADGDAILIVATEPAGLPLSLRERVSRLIADSDEALIAFAPDGACLALTPAARERFGDDPTIAALGLADLAPQALHTGAVHGVVAHATVTLERLGDDASTVLLARFGAVATESAGAAAEAAPEAASQAPSQPPSAAAADDPPEEPPTERRLPLRFVWQMDADGRFVVGSDDFIELMGPRTTAVGRPWSDIAGTLGLDPRNEIARAVATRETFSGITIDWPLEDGSARLPVELSGLPVFDRDRTFRGYRGFGVCRDLDRINHLLHTQRERPIGFAAAELEPPPRDSAPRAAAVAESGDAAAASAADAAAADNVVPFPAGAAAEGKTPALNAIERSAFRELAQELTARLRGARAQLAEDSVTPPADEPAPAASHLSSAPTDRRAPAASSSASSSASWTALFDRLPLGVLVYRSGPSGETPLYANRYFLGLTGHDGVEAFAAAGGLTRLFAEADAQPLAAGERAQPLAILDRAGNRRPVEGRLLTIPWEEGAALALLLSNGEAEERRQAHALSLSTAQSEIRELKSHVEAFKKTEAEMRAATREAQRAAATKAEFVNKLSHEIRTPLNAITGFAEVMIAERFGPLGNERYREYLKDIHAAGMHVVSVLNDLLDLSKVEIGQHDLSFANVSLNELTQQCVGIMQPQASKARIIIRTSLTPGLPQVVADERSLRQIVLNLLSNSIKFTGPGGQVIVSTAFADSGEAILRVRDTGAGMSEKDLEAALEPFQQAAAAGGWGAGGTGLGLPLTKALAEANRAHFSIKSSPNAGTLVEVAFPPARVTR